MATLDVTPKEGKNTEQELRAQREKIYCTDTQGGAPCTPGAIAQALGITHAGDIPPMEGRITMFHRLVEQNFVQEMDVFSEHYPNSWQTHVLSQFKAYHAFLDYAKTPYGAVMMGRILRDNFTSSFIGVKRFKIIRDDNDSAKGGPDVIKLPTGFPLITVLNTGDKVDPSAIIHHEFGHTRFFKGHHSRKEVSIQDERIAVIRMENPARMYNKNEPRYAYYHPDLGVTINIITGQVKHGIWATDKADPRIFIEPGKKTP
ncbi:MAG: hypothetical protein HY080_06950 [Gammaproteobacteria bacterium]|nr:hypothetical protein [Gammaproteobacteria bacterium]